MWWKDARLAYNGTADGGCVDKLVYNAADAKAQLWQPDFYFEFDATTPVVGAEGDGYLLEVYPDGSIWTSKRARLKMRCKFHFGNFPYDSQSCPFELGFYSQTASEAVLKWCDETVSGCTVGKDGETALVNVAGKRSAEFDYGVPLQTDKLLVYSTSNYTYARADIPLTRDATQYGEYVGRFTLFVFLSYLGFWINPAAAPGRIALALLMILIPYTLYGVLASRLPAVTYPVWLKDVLSEAIYFNIIAFVEYACVNFGMQVHARLEKEKAAIKEGMAPADAKAKSRKSVGEPGADGGDPDNDEGDGKPPPPPKLSIGISLPGLPAMRSAEANDLLEKGGGCWRQWEMRLAQLKDADKFFRVAFMPCYGIFLAAKFSQIEAYAHADE